MCPTVYQDQLLSNFIDSVRSKSIDPTFRCHSRWLGEIAERGTRSSALVWAIRAISLSTSGRQAGDEDLVQASRRVYGKSLLKLNDAIKDPEEGLSTDTLCATVILSFYEVFNCTDQNSRIKHAGGTGHLIRLRGPDRHRSDFGCSVFIACRHSLIMEAFSTRTPCFLDAPPWRKLCREIQRTSSWQTPISGVNEDFFQEIVTQPGYLGTAVSAVLDPNSNLEDLKNLLARAYAHRAILRDLFERLCNALKKAGLDRKVRPASPQGNKATPFPLLYEYPDIHIAAMYCGFYNISTAINVSIIGLESRLQRAYQHPTPSGSQAQQYAQRRHSRSPNPDVPPSQYQAQQYSPPQIFDPNPTIDPSQLTQPPTLPSQPLPSTRRSTPFNPTRSSHSPVSTPQRQTQYPLFASVATSSPSHLLFKENLFYATEICESNPDMARAPFLGPLFLVMALRVSLRIVRGEREKEWVIDVLEGIGRRMGLAGAMVDESLGGKGKGFWGVGHRLVQEAGGL